LNKRREIVQWATQEGIPSDDPRENGEWKRKKFSEIDASWIEEDFNGLRRKEEILPNEFIGQLNKEIPIQTYGLKIVCQKSFFCAGL
jgi:hypothetical protein